MLASGKPRIQIRIPITTAVVLQPNVLIESATTPTSVPPKFIPDDTIPVAKPRLRENQFWVAVITGRNPEKLAPRTRKGKTM
jgi:hypothetical protein